MSCLPAEVSCPELTRRYCLGGDVIGQGTFGRVRKATCRETGIVYAVKTVQSQRGKPMKVRLPCKPSLAYGASFVTTFSGLNHLQPAAGG